MAINTFAGVNYNTFSGGGPGEIELPQIASDSCPTGTVNVTEYLTRLLKVDLGGVQACYRFNQNDSPVTTLIGNNLAYSEQVLYLIPSEGTVFNITETCKQLLSGVPGSGKYLCDGLAQHYYRHPDTGDVFGTIIQVPVVNNDAMIPFIHPEASLTEIITNQADIFFLPVGMEKFLETVLMFKNDFESIKKVIPPLSPEGSEYSSEVTTTVLSVLTVLVGLIIAVHGAGMFLSYASEKVGSVVRRGVDKTQKIVTDTKEKVDEAVKRVRNGK